MNINDNMSEYSGSFLLKVFNWVYSTTLVEQVEHMLIKIKYNLRHNFNLDHV